jgi:hypothetical protein
MALHALKAVKMMFLADPENAVLLLTQLLVEKVQRMM